MHNKGLWGRLAILLTTMIWGTSFVILKNTLDVIPAMWILAARFVIAALLLSLCAGKRFRAMRRGDIRGGILMGVCLATAYILQTYGLVYTTPGKNAFLTSAYCIMVPFMTWGFFARRPEKRVIPATLMCLAGIGFVSLGRDFSVNIGDMLTLACGIFYALHIIVCEKYAPDCDTLALTAVQFASAALICLVGAFIAEPIPRQLSGEAVFSVLYLAVMCTAVCFFLQVWGQKYTPSSTAAVLMTLESVFGTLISVIFYDEKLSLRIILGFALIFISVVLTSVEPKGAKRI